MRSLYTILAKRFGKRTIRIFLGGILIVAVALFLFGGDTEPTPTTDEWKVVRTAMVAELAATANGFSTIGTVRAVSEARLQTESAGRVSAVHVSIGDRVAAGTVLARIENTREQAA